MNLERDGVELWRGTINMELLKAVVKEYEETTPDVEGIPKHVPIVVFWTHIPGHAKKVKLLSDMPKMSILSQYIANKVRIHATGAMRLLETIIFNKPPGISNTLGWHQDVSYFPFNPNNQIAVWIPFEEVTKESGAMVYALGSHKKGLRASTDLHSGKVFDGEDRAPIDVTGFQTPVMEMSPGDMLIHDGRTWHMSGPNTVEGRQRRGLSLRFLVGETRYKPRAGSAAAFLKQIDDLQPGDLVADPAFPIL